MDRYLPMQTPFIESFSGFGVPLELQEAFWNYFMYGLEPGGFGMAILRNDFVDAVCRAHRSLTADHFREIALWFSNTRLPRDSYGSDDNIEKWKRLSNEERRIIMEDLKLCPTVFDVLRGVPGPKL